MIDSSISWLCFPIAFAQTPTSNDVSSARWQRSYLLFLYSGGSGDANGLNQTCLSPVDLVIISDELSQVDRTD